MLPSNPKRPVIAVSNPKSPISEAYRTLRTNIQFSGIDGDLQTLMVTSASPWEGKSTTISNLAAVYAQGDKQVLLIDADLRKPTAHHTFSLSNRLGLTDVLSGRCSLDDAIKGAEVAKLSILPAGTIPPNPTEMLGSSKMSRLLEELKMSYDIILIDTPPVLAVSDAQIVSRQCDGVILVVDSGRIKRDLVKRAKDSLMFVQARLLGVVLNNVSRKHAKADYDYYYGH